MLTQDVFLHVWGGFSHIKESPIISARNRITGDSVNRQNIVKISLKGRDQKGLGVEKMERKRTGRQN